MASAWIDTRQTKSGIRYRVRYRTGGREAPQRFGGSFRTLAEARIRRNWIAGELAAMRIPDIKNFQ